jgi:hypothetical protein
MRKLIYAFGALGLALLAQAGAVQPAAAEVIYPWCAHYSGRGMGGAPSCGFVSYRQCMATISGMGGYCAENPFYTPPPRAGREYLRVR